MSNSFKILTQNSKSIVTQNGLYYLVYAEELPPISAGTEYTLCAPNCSGGTTELILPHPVWITNYGMNVVQQNAVTLGGPDGLNN